MGEKSFLAFCRHEKPLKVFYGDLPGNEEQKTYLGSMLKSLQTRRPKILLRQLFIFVAQRNKFTQT